ncbi:DEAD/DEAH box helicase family protein [Listeria booriae]|uniref:DEAD/DEAH box helicase family protein n=1 Tax=Listeria booriae TaxID=1552123 RepID=UPI001625FBA3|nr:DEAD/DEAH box helicase family protein [Listeria booriae]MBC1945375.1 DEAD/DEAH box helicase family protein [Listeria booriae]
MVKFGDKIKTSNLDKKTHPIELYDTLDRASDKGPLRPVQKEILESWFNHRYKEKDILLKLHTGQGKTLIGLLMLQSRLNKGTGPAIYVCPNNYLVEQTKIQAEQFGIKYATYENSEIPDEFIDEKAILIVTVQVLFNGLSKFGIGRRCVEASTILLDDAHSCIEVINNSCKISISNAKAPYNEILNLFSVDLERQGMGTFAEITSKKHEALLNVPYWAWQEKHAEVVTILNNHSDLKEIKFPWPIIKDNIKNCDCYISGGGIEIVPYLLPLEEFGTYAKAQQRIYMSATLADDSILVQGLGISADAITNPLRIDNEEWSGEKMLLIPSLIDSTLNREEIVHHLATNETVDRGGRVVIAPSFNKTKDWKKYGAKVVTTESINDEITKLKQGDIKKTVVFANRYDGIDLPDNSCRVLTIDSEPHFDSLQDRYFESCRSDSDMILMKKAQKIEQGIGRSVRGERDYSAIVLIGSELVRLIRSRKTRNYFSLQTQKQIDIGMEIIEFAKQDISETKPSMEVFTDLIEQLIKRDPDWKEFYIEKMNKIAPENPKSKVLDTLVAEKNAIEKYQKGEYQVAVDMIQELVDKNQFNDDEKGWYMQKMANFIYPLSKQQSNKYQTLAHNKNRYLLLPKEGSSFTKLSTVSMKRVENIKSNMESHGDFDELLTNLNGILEDLRFGVKADRFEAAFNSLGKFLGFETERPDKEWKEGPDNLWGLENNRYLLVECKNEVGLDRQEIHKAETGQMNNASAWFMKNYQHSDVTRMLIIPTKKVSRGAGFTESVQILRKRGLARLSENVRNFFNEFKTTNFASLSEGKIQQNLDLHNLSVDKIIDDYTEVPKNL